MPAPAGNCRCLRLPWNTYLGQRRASVGTLHYPIQGRAVDTWPAGHPCTGHYILRPQSGARVESIDPLVPYRGLPTVRPAAPMNRALHLSRSTYYWQPCGYKLARPSLAVRPDTTRARRYRPALGELSESMYSRRPICPAPRPWRLRLWQTNRNPVWCSRGHLHL
jgi:hypothetical protein